MRTRSWVLIGAAVLGVSACGGGNSRPPTAPSAAVNVAPGSGSAGPNISITNVSWSCLTNQVPGSSFGPSGCPVRAATTRVRASAATSAPGAPAGLSAAVGGTTVTLTWVGPSTGDAPTSYQVEAGSATGAADLANFNTGGTATTLVVTNVPSATYFVRVRAVDSAGASAPSNEIVVIVTGGGPCAVVGVPSSLTSTVSGSVVTLNWSAPAGGCPPTSYVIQAGSTAGGANLANFSTGSVLTTYVANGVGNGTYYVRVYATNGNGLSGPSNEIAVVVGPPPPPVPVISQFLFYDPSTQAGPTTECRIRNPATPPERSTCTLQSTSFTLGANAIVSYAWTVTYTYGDVKTITGTMPIFSFTELCGGVGATGDGAATPLNVTLTVTDNLGNSATAVSGSGSQPALALRIYNCGA